MTPVTAWARACSRALRQLEPFADGTSRGAARGRQRSRDIWRYMPVDRQRRGFDAWLQADRGGQWQRARCIIFVVRRHADGAHRRLDVLSQHRARTMRAWRSASPGMCQRRKAARSTRNAKYAAARERVRGAVTTASNSRPMPSQCAQPRRHHQAGREGRRHLARPYVDAAGLFARHGLLSRCWREEWPAVKAASRKAAGRLFELSSCKLRIRAFLSRGRTPIFGPT